ncbi:MAG: hypothetical protein HZY76_12625 [Anaerolineae bacterium]|nr:MAG: hypothetical protein HZY76_12625 [Anaerolineae bacterium]
MEVRQTAQALSFEKVDRAALGELFVNLGTHLKTGGSLADILQGLVSLNNLSPGRDEPTMHPAADHADVTPANAGTRAGAFARHDSR